MKVKRADRSANGLNIWKYNRHKFSGIKKND